MKKIRAILLCCLFLTFTMSGCGKEGNYKENEQEIDYSILLNSGSCFVYTFRDEETGVWYISTSEGVTPRLNTDGTLYVSD